ncbi:sigma factor AlgU regulator MucB [Maricurvus nonylphenolicus]|uniref:MucB/RseB C-terminal domain-containing protein n=1 Tax=Maricurvus nonylphenolicus TaxID=1008307 RepID=UPI0036F29C14
MTDARLFSFFYRSSLSGVAKALGSFFVFLSLLVATPALANVGGDKVLARLADMSRALRELSYQGLVTYEHGGALESLKLTHIVRDGVEYARLDRLNGPEQPRLQRGLPTACVPVADQLLRGLLNPFGDESRNLEQSYHFYMRGRERIAGRQAEVIQIVPRDQYRHGYNLAIDELTALPLRAMIVSHDKRVLERFQFVDLQTETEVAQAAAQQQEQPVSGADTEAEAAVAQNELPCPAVASSAPTAAGSWQVGWMPSGFVLSSVQQAGLLGEVLMYTDGLSAFSVFVSKPQQQGFDFGRAQLGATVAYIHPVKVANQPFVITVVGEIPTKTAMRIASSVKPR